MLGMKHGSVLCAVGLVASLLTNVTITTGAGSQSSLTTSTMVVKSADLRAEINSFLGKELAAHLSDIKTLEPPPDRVVGALTTGEFSWGTFMRALAAYAETTGQTDLAGRALAKWVGKIGRASCRERVLRLV